MSLGTSLKDENEPPIVVLDHLSASLRIAAFKLHHKKDLGGAACIFRNCIESHPKDFRAYFNLGTILDAPGDLRDYEGAARLFRQAILLNASIIESYACLSGVLLKLNRPQESVRICRAGLLVVPTNPPCLYNLQVALRMTGEMQKAIDFTSIALGESSIQSRGGTERGDADVSRCPVLYVCVKWGKKYGPEYVNALYRSLLHHHIDPPRLVCLTEDPQGVMSGVECRPFPSCCEAWEAWWLKGAVFDPSLLRKEGEEEATVSEEYMQNGGVWVVYLDLDSVLCGPVTPVSLLSFDCGSSSSGRAKSLTLYTLSADLFDNEQRVQGINSSLMLWHVPLGPRDMGQKNEGFSGLYQYLKSHYAALRCVVYKFDHYLEMQLMDESKSEQRGRCELLGGDSIVDFNRFVKSTNVSSHSLSELRDACGGRNVVCFPLEPKPSAVLEKYAWVAEYFRNPASVEEVD